MRRTERRIDKRQKNGSRLAALRGFKNCRAFSPPRRCERPANRTSSLRPRRVPPITGLRAGEKNCVSHISLAVPNSDPIEAQTMSFLQNLVARFVPTVRADDDEIVDPQKVLREKCSGEKKCSAFQEKLTTCNDRVNSRKKTEETCLEELIDYVNCVDHCVSHTLFTKLK